MYFKAISPSEVPSKADSIYFCYKLIYKEKRLTPYLYSDRCLYDRDSDFVILSAYHEDFLDPEKTQFDTDISMFLVALDFNNLKIVRFSNVIGGSYSDIHIQGNKLYYKKHKGSIIQDTEVYLPDLQWEDLKI